MPDPNVAVSSVSATPAEHTKPQALDKPLGASGAKTAGGASAGELSFARLLLAQPEPNEAQAVADQVRQNQAAFDPMFKRALNWLSEPALAPVSHDLTVKNDAVTQDEPSTPVSAAKSAKTSSDEAAEKPAVAKTPSKPTTEPPSALTLNLLAPTLPQSQAQISLQGALTQSINGVNSANAATGVLAAANTGLLSEKMQTLLAQAQKNGSPIRVDLNDGAQLILRLRQGKVSAEFLSSQPGILSSTLPLQLEALKQKLLAQDLPVDSLIVRHQEQQQRQQHQNEQSQSEQEPKSFSLAEVIDAAQNTRLAQPVPVGV
ncbi:MAG: hypothetical protein VKJ06_00350 [Vampirovibrionales bacterium]|nr:hypothetical protein [Vampirovibrionales bacterium]